MSEPAKRARKKAEPPSVAAAQRLAALVSAAPKLSSPKEARDRVDEWLAEIGRTAAGKALKPLLAADTKSKLGGVVTAIADASPYLWDLIGADPDRFLGILQADPESRFATLVANVTRAGLAEEDESEMMRVLRRAKAEAALLIALADIGGAWPVERVTRALTELADTTTNASVRFLLRGAAAQGKLKVQNAAAPEEGTGYIVLAMGKMGAFELNYSSDIDLIVLYDENAPALAGTEPGALMARLTRGLVKLMQERTDGYVFRTDLRLRPDPASTPIAVSMLSALNYYESTGQNWERAAMIKARPCAGDRAAGE